MIVKGDRVRDRRIKPPIWGKVVVVGSEVSEVKWEKPEFPHYPETTYVPNEHLEKEKEK